MDFKTIYRDFAVSFEIFPPKTEEGLAALYSELDILAKYNPAFISVTYGAGGSTREKTLDLACGIRRRYGITPLIHFTCVGSGREEIRQYLGKVRELGLTDILALRGDPPRGQADFVPAADGFSYAHELVDFIAQQGGFNIAVAGYPEKHVDCADLETDIKNLKVKVDAGASLVLTQLFFNNRDYFHLTDSLRALGSDITVIPGIMPLTAPQQVEKIAAMCGAHVPDSLVRALNSAASPEDAAQAGIDFAVKQCLELKAHGVKGFHFYPLNKAYAVEKILQQVL
ncbi:MAG: methylenetetrahydrofolate reductase [NAD(P)H] [Spirochaetota bacterium]